MQETLARRYVRWRHIDHVESPAGYPRAALTNAYIDRTRRRSHHEPPLAEVADIGVRAVGLSLQGERLGQRAGLLHADGSRCVE